MNQYWPPYPSGSILDGANGYNGYRGGSPLGYDSPDTEEVWSPRNMSRYRISGSGALYVESNPITTVSGATTSLDISDDLVNRLWDKLYNKKPIVFCTYCNSGNVFDNPTCVQCGAPMGDSVR